MTNGDLLREYQAFFVRQGMDLDETDAAYRRAEFIEAEVKRRMVEPRR